MMPKVLIVAYYWPPAGGPGVQRWLSFVKHLPQYGVDPIVFVPENAAYPILDKNLESEVSKSVQIIKFPIREPLRFVHKLMGTKSKSISSGMIKKQSEQGLLEKLLLWIRGNYFIPDARKAWVLPATRYLEKVILEDQIDQIITTGPPHSLHLIGMSLKQKNDVRWIADFRDPWTTIGYHQKLKLSKKSKEKHLTLEKEVLTTADHIIVTSHKTKESLARKTSRPISVITNGYETYPIINKLDTSFSLVHIGSLLNERNPISLWKALADLKNNQPEFEAFLTIKLAGVVGDEIKNSLDQYGLSTNTEYLGYLPHEEALKLQRGAQVLLLLEINKDITSEIIPGKLFEYFKAERPILALGPPNWEAGFMVENHEAGSYLHSDYEVSIRQTVLHWFKSFMANQLEIHPKGIERYDRKELTRSLSKIIHGHSH